MTQNISTINVQKHDAHFLNKYARYTDSNKTSRKMSVIHGYLQGFLSKIYFFIETLTGKFNYELDILRHIIIAI